MTTSYNISKGMKEGKKRRKEGKERSRERVEVEGLTRRREADLLQVGGGGFGSLEAA
jgi:hypothetical protein